MKGYFNYFPDEWSIIGTVARWTGVQWNSWRQLMNPREMVLISAIKTILAVAENNDNQWDWTSYTCVSAQQWYWQQYLPSSVVRTPYYLHVLVVYL